VNLNSNVFILSTNNMCYSILKCRNFLNLVVVLNQLNAFAWFFRIISLLRAVYWAVYWALAKQQLGQRAHYPADPFPLKPYPSRRRALPPLPRALPHICLSSALPLLRPSQIARSSSGVRWGETAAHRCRTPLSRSWPSHLSVALKLRPRRDLGLRRFL
jgi:hypothetical protein